MDKSERTVFRACFELILDLEDQLEMQGEYSANLERDLDELRKPGSGDDPLTAHRPGQMAVDVMDKPWMDGDLIDAAGALMLFDCIAKLRRHASLAPLGEEPEAIVSHWADASTMIQECQEIATALVAWISRLRSDGTRVKTPWYDFFQEWKAKQKAPGHRGSRS